MPPEASAGCSGCEPGGAGAGHADFSLDSGLTTGCKSAPLVGWHDGRMLPFVRLSDAFVTSQTTLVPDSL
jgi:hypothetical protein